MTYETLEINPGGGYDDYSLQIREMETLTLMELYRIMRDNPTIFQEIESELHHRSRNKEELDHIGQIGQLNLLLGLE